MKKKKGFTLVELLAVIVILAVILIIAMPKISDVIKNSKEASLETTAKLIASQAEKKYTENQVLDSSTTIKCSDVAKINDTDYESCNITFDSKGNAKVTIVGKGKFDGMAVCNANKNSASISSDCATNAKYFSYEDIDDGLVKTLSVTVEDVNKCISYLQTLGAPEETATTLCNDNVNDVGDGDTSIKSLIEEDEIPSSDYEIAGLKVEYLVKNVEVKDANKCKTYFMNLGGATEDQVATLCNGGSITIGEKTGSLKDVVFGGNIPSSDYETAGLNITYKPYEPNSSIKITGYNIEGGTDVVIPSQIYGKTVVAIGDNAFYDRGYGLGITSVVIPNTVTSIGRHAFSGNKLTNITIPSSVIEISFEAFYGNQISSITFPDTPITLDCWVFNDNPIMKDSSYSFPSNVVLPDSSKCVLR